MSDSKGKSKVPEDTKPANFWNSWDYAKMENEIFQSLHKYGGNFEHLYLGSWSISDNQSSKA